MFASRQFSPARYILATALILVTLTVAASRSAEAQAFAVIHTFTGAADGAEPYGTLTLDRQGNLYGTASGGGLRGGNCPSGGCGTVFKLTPRSNSWIFTPLYSFQGNPDGANPLSGVTIGPNGSLYGTTYYGGNNVGTVYNLRPAARFSGNVLGGWNETVIDRFGMGEDGKYPGTGNVIFDPAGNLYGTTSEGGVQCTMDVGDCGTMFKLTPSGGSWIESYFAFPGGSGGGNPLSGVVRDAAGNLYGTTDIASFNSVVYQLTPSGSGWTETTLFTFGAFTDPRAGVILDGAGCLYGATIDGVVCQLSPSGGLWNYSVIHSFTGSSGIWNSVLRDDSGNLYGATCADGTHGKGSVFKLTPSGGSWTETDLYDFTGGSDGSCPIGGVARDAVGNLYGTTMFGGSGCGGSGCGVVWAITP